MVPGVMSFNTHSILGRLTSGDVIFWKKNPIPHDDGPGQASRYTRSEHSTSLRHNESGVVDKEGNEVIFMIKCNTQWKKLINS